jgi:hypothetical protein
MAFNLYSYASKQNVNFTSMGKQAGNFSMDKKGVQKMYEVIAKGNLDSFCMVERKTPYFKLFFDLDNKKMDKQFKKINEKKFWSYCTKTIVTVLKKFIVEEKTTFQYIYSTRTDTTHGLHLYFPNIVINSEYAMLLRNQIVKQLIEEEVYKNLTREDYEQIVDDSVYKGNGLRLLFQKKYNKDTKKQEKGDYIIDVKSSTVKKIPTKKVDQLSLTSIRSARNTPNVKFIVDEKRELPLLDILKEKTIIKEKQKKKEDTPLEPVDVKGLQECNIDMDLVKQFVHNLSLKRITTYSTWLRFIFLCRNYGWSELAHEISKKAKNYSAKAVNSILKSPAKGKLYTIGSLLYWSKMDNPEKHNKIRQQNDMCKLTTKQLTCDHKDNFEKYADEVYENEFVNELDLENFDTFIIKAATGTGKTERIISSINKLVKGKKADRITLLASRILLAINIHGRFQEPLHGSTKPLNLGMKLYCDVEKKSENLKKYKRLIQTPDSLIHMIKPSHTVNYKESECLNEDGYLEDAYNDIHLDIPDILFVDEIESLLEYVCTSSTLQKNRKEIFTILNSYIANAKYVFLVDSNVTMTVCDYIKKLRKHKNVNVIFNKKKTNDSTYYLTYDEVYWTNTIKSCLKRNEKVFIGSDSKKQTDYLLNTLNAAKIKVYNCDTDDKSRNALALVNEEWKKYDVVICSPTILYGVDFNVQHFDTVFGYYTKTINASAIYQQLNRVRKIKSKTCYVYVQDFRLANVHPMPTTLKEIGQFYFKYKNEFQKELSNLAIDYTKLFTLNEEDLFTRLYLHFQAETNRCHNAFQDRLTKYITEFGGKLIALQNSSHKGDINKFYEKKKLINNTIDEQNNKLLVEASKFIDVCDEINNKKSKTTMDRKILTASKICYDLQLNELDNKLLNSFNHIRDINKLVESFQYVMDMKQLAKLAKNNIDMKIETFNKKKNIIASGNQLFFKDHLFSTEKITVLKTPLTKEQKKWFEENKADLLYFFKDLRQERLKIKDQVSLLKLINRITEDFFAGTVDSVTKRTKKQINKKKYIGITCQRSNEIYIELLLNSRSNFLNDLYIKKCSVYSNKNCIYSQLHGHATIGKMIKQINDQRAYQKLDIDSVDFIPDDYGITN